MASGDKNKQEQINKYKELKPSCIIRTVSKLITDPIANKLIERQMLLLDDYFLGSPCGFWMNDVPYVTQVIEKIIEKIDNEPRFIPYLKKLLELCGLPPLLVNSTDILEIINDLIEYFSFLGFLLLTLQDKILKILLIKSLNSLVKRKNCVPIRAISLKDINRAIEESKIPKILGSLIEICWDHEFYPEIIKISTHLTKTSEKIAETILKSDALNFLFLKLDPYWNKSNDDEELKTKEILFLNEILELISYLLNALYYSSGKIKKIISTPNLEALRSFRVVLKAIVRDGNKTDRNFLIMILILLMECFPNARIVEANLAHDICILCIASEKRPIGTWAGLIKFDTEPLDYELKRMLILGIYYITKYFGGKELVEDLDVIYELSKLINPQLSLKWSDDRLCKLRHSVLTIFERMMPLFYQQLEESHGITRLLMLIEFYTFKPYSPKLLIAALKCLNAFLTIEDKTILIKSEPEYIKYILEDLIDYILEKQNLNTTNQSILTFIYSNLNLLSLYNRKLVEDVDLGLKFLNRALNLKENDMQYDPKLMITSVNYIWDLCIRNDRSFIRFVDQKGIYVLLNILKDATFPVKIIILGYLVDVCEEGTGIPYFVTWRYNNVSLVSLLVRIFQEENKLIGVQLTNRGVVENFEFPIMGKYQSEQIIEDLEQSPCLTDMICSCRPKIYALINLLNVRHHQKVQIANEHYKLHEINLTIDDQIGKLLAENYLVFKLGEAWSELKRFFDKINFDLTGYDKYLLVSLEKHYAHLGKNIQELQKVWLKNEYKEENLTEESFYELLRESKLQGALEALEELSFIARTSDAHFHMRFKKESDGSPQTYNGDAHGTRNLLGNIASPVKQKLFIQSDIIVDPDNEEAPPSVSSITNEVDFDYISDIESEGSKDLRKHLDGKLC